MPLNSFARRAVAAMLVCLAGGAVATNYSLWIHGRGTGGKPGNHADFTYWGPASVAAGANKKSVNWDGYSRVSTENFRIRDALDCYCTGNNWCYIAAHNAGDLQIGYAISLYGSSSRFVRNATPNASGQCGSTGSTQVGWNIKWVRVAGGAGGGSELADYGAWSAAEPLSKDLVTTTARAMYDHNQTRGNVFYMYAGAKGTLYANVLKGQNDEAVAYHSAGGISGSAGVALGNPVDFFSNDLTLGTAANEGGSVKWTNHVVTLRDDAESLDHYTRGNWQGVVSPMRADMVNNAR